MARDYRQLRDSDGRSQVGPSAGHGLVPGKRTLVEQAGEGVPVQRKQAGTEGSTEVHEAAQRGVAGPGSALPHLDTIQLAFGRHDVGSIQAHTGTEAQQASREIGASAFATGNHVAFGAAPDLHTAAHEAAHVVQQRAGVQLKGGVGSAGDTYEQHADNVADTVVAGRSAEALLSEMAGAPTSTTGEQAVQRQETTGGGGPTQGDIIAVRAKLAAARALLADTTAPLSDSERKQLETAVVNTELALSSFNDLSGQGQQRAAAMAPLALAGGGILADDATGVGVADDPLLILVGIGMLATLLLTRAPASDQQLAQSWSKVVSNLQTVAAAGTTLVMLKINGDRLRGNTGQLAAHLARLLALASVGGVPSGEPPKNNNDNDPHWWKEIKAFLKNIQSAIGAASRKQALRELGKKFTEEQILEIERQLAEAAKRMGEPPPGFLPPP